MKTDFNEPLSKPQWIRGKQQTIRQSESHWNHIKCFGSWFLINFWFKPCNNVATGVQLTLLPHKTRGAAIGSGYTAS